MSEELMNRARKLLALRDKATPGPWSVFGDANSIAAHGAKFKTSSSAYWDYLSENLLFGNEFRRTEDANFAASAHEMAETISDLVAEVERLNGLLNAQNETMMEAITRTNSAEYRLRELASAEPVAWSFRDLHGVYHLEKGGTPPLYEHTDAFALVRRPEMPS